jgi:hypothetical protein
MDYLSRGTSDVLIKSEDIWYAAKVRDSQGRQV